MLAALKLGGIGLAVLAGLLAINEWVENPLIRQSERDKVTSLVEAAAARATRDEQLRQFKIAERVFGKAEHERQETEAWHQARINLLNQEIADYVASSQKHSLDDCDLAFLGGLRCPHPTAAGGR